MIMSYLKKQKWVALFTIFFLLATPMGRIYAWAADDASFLNSAGEGQSFGKSIIPMFEMLMSEDGQASVNTGSSSSGGTSFTLEELVQGFDAAEQAEKESVYGDEDVFTESIVDTQTELSDSDSMTGQAYQLLNTTMYEHSHPNLTNDAIFGTTTEVLADVVAGEFADCSSSPEYNNTVSTIHMPDMQVCERIIKPGDCTATRSILSIDKYLIQLCEPGSHIATINGFTYQCGSDGNSYYVPEVDLSGIGYTLATNYDVDQSGYNFTQVCEINEEETAVICETGNDGITDIIVWDFVTVEDLQPEGFTYRWWWCDTCSNDIDRKLFGPNGTLAKTVYDSGGWSTTYCELRQSNIWQCRSYNEGEDEVCGWKPSLYCYFEYLEGPGESFTFTMSNKDEGIVVAPGDYLEYWRYNATRDLSLWYNGEYWFRKGGGKPSTYASGVKQPRPTTPWYKVNENISYEPAGCNESGFCDHDDSGWECTDPDSARTYFDIEFTQEMAQVWLSPLFPNDTHEPDVCWEASVPLTCDFNVGAMACYTDINGVEHCPDNAGDLEDTCDEYEDDPGCSFIRSTCINGARDDYGNCYAYSDVYDCGNDIVDETIVRQDVVTCDASVRCMGTECVTPEVVVGDDFEETAAMLSAMQFMAADLKCNEDAENATEEILITDCNVFGGTDYECKKALGGWQNCCDQPISTSLSDYIELTVNVDKLTGASDYLTSLISTEGSTSGASGWGTWVNMADTTIDYCTTAWNSIAGTGSSTAAGTTAGTAAGTTGTTTASEGVIATALQEVTDAIAQWVYDTFGEAAYNMFFEAASSTVVEEGAQQVAGDVSGSALGGSVGGLLASALSFIMWAYLIYQILNLLVQIIFECEDEEFELASKRALESCTYIGTYCATEGMGCIEVRDSYCCYESPLSRILNEQLREQLEMDRGTPETPNCDGILVEDLDQIDWSLVDLSEWIGILKMSGAVSLSDDFEFDMESLTGAGSTFNFGSDDPESEDARDNVAERTVDRINYTEDIEDVAQEKRQELWGQ